MRFRRFAIAAVVAASFACSEVPADGAPAVRLTEIDGVERLTYASFPPEKLNRIRTTRVFSTAEARPSLDLFQITGAVFLEDLSLLVADWSRGELVLLSPEGALVRRWGRRGDGPGEFRNLAMIGVGAGDTIFAWDHQLGRISLFTKTGDLIDTVPLDIRGGRYRPLALLGGGRIIGVEENRPSVSELSRLRSELALTVVDLRTAHRDTLGTWAGLEFAARPGRLEDQFFIEPIAYPASIATDGAGEQVVLGSTDSLHISRYSATDLVQEVVAPSPREPVSQRARDAMHEVLSEWYGDPGAQAPVNEYLPLYRGLMTDDQGRLWIGAYTVPYERSRRWIVLSRKGEAIGELALPALPLSWPASRFAAHIAPQTELLDVRGDRIAVYGRDELDVEFIEVRVIDDR